MRVTAGARCEHVEHDRGADVVRQVPAAHPRALAERRRPVELRRVGVQDLDRGPVPHRLGETRQQRSIELDRQHALGARVGQRRRQRPEPRPDLDHAHPRPDPGVARDRAGEVRIQQEVLAERLGRADRVRLGEARAPTSYQSSSTWRTPRPSGASCAKASGERSMIRPGPNGPRSSITTVTERPVARSVTVTCVPNGQPRVCGGQPGPRRVVPGGLAGLRRRAGARLGERAVVHRPRGGRAAARRRAARRRSAAVVRGRHDAVR